MMLVLHQHFIHMVIVLLNLILFLKRHHLLHAHDPIINKFLLYNDIRSVLSEKNVGFMFGEVEGIGSQFLQSLTDTLWYIDGQYHKFESRYKHGMVPSIPEI